MGTGYENQKGSDEHAVSESDLQHLKTFIINHMAQYIFWS